MGASHFNIGVLQQTGRMLLRESWTVHHVDGAMNWLRSEDARGAHIFVRPHGELALTLIDDVSESTIAEGRLSGFEPAAIVETSAANFQVWSSHGRVLNRDLSSLAAKELGRRFGGDLSSADWRHFGRLAGFTNQKETRRSRTK